MQKTLYIPIDTTLNYEFECPLLVKKYDTLKFKFAIFSLGILQDLNGQAVDVILHKKDGTTIQKTITDITLNIATIVLDKNASACIGEVLGEIVITDAGGQATSNSFKFNVSNSLTEDIEIKSKDDIATIEDMRALIATYKNEISAIGESTQAVEALNNITTYIDTNLSELTSKNAAAVKNVTDLKKENDRADTNIPGLTNLNDTAEEKLQEFREFDTSNIVTTLRDHGSQLNENAKQISKKIFASHRGYWTGTDNLYAVENSIEGLRESIKNGFNGMECDPRKDVNGNIILLHDETVDRTTSGTGKITEIDYSKCILLDKGGNINELGATIPLLEDIIKIASYEQDFWLVIDGGKNVVTASEIKTLCDKYNYHKIIYENFDLATVKALDPYAYTLNTITDFSETNLKNLEQYLPNVYLALSTVSDINTYSDTIKAHGFRIEGYAYESTLNGTYLAMINDTTISNKIDMFVSEVTKDRGYKNSVFKSYSTAPKLYKSIKDIIPTYIGTSGSTSISDVIAAMDEYSVLFTKLSATLDSILYPSGFSSSGVILQIQKVDAYGAYVTMVDRYSNYGYIRHGIWSSTNGISYYTVSNKITSYNYLVSIPNFSTASTTLSSLISSLPPYTQVQSILSKSWACCPSFVDSTGAFITIKKTDINVSEIWITPRNTAVLDIWKGFWNGTTISWVKFTGTLQS